MQRIIQLDEADYNKLAELAKLNEKQIDEKALELWKKKGIPNLTITLYIGGNFIHYDELVSEADMYTSDERFFIPENFRKRIERYVNYRIKEAFKSYYEDPDKLEKLYQQKIEMIKYVRWTMYFIALSGWVYALLK